MSHTPRDYFAAAGSLIACNVMFDRLTGKSRGFAFVEFATGEEAAKAIEMFHQKESQGRALSVNVARPREDRAPRGPRGTSEEFGARA